MTVFIKALFEKSPFGAFSLLVLTIIIYFLRWIISHKIDNKKVSLKQIEIANLIIKRDLHRPSKKQRFLTEQIFNSMFSYSFTYKEIYALLNAHEPSKAFYLFKRGASYLKLSKSGKSFVMDKKYKVFKFKKWEVFAFEIKSFFFYLMGAMFSLVFLSLSLGLYNKEITYKLFSDYPMVWAAYFALLSILMIIFSIGIAWKGGTISKANTLSKYYK